MLILLSFLIILILLKSTALDTTIVTADSGMLILEVITSEGLFMMVLILMFVGSIFVNGRMQSMVCRAAILVILCASFFDLYLLHSFQTRLSLEYFQQFAAEIDTLLFFVKLKVHHASIYFYLVAICVVVLMLTFLLKNNPNHFNKSICCHPSSTTLLGIHTVKHHSREGFSVSQPQPQTVYFTRPEWSLIIYMHIVGKIRSIFCSTVMTPVLSGKITITPTKASC